MPRLARLAFLAAACFAFVMAVLPHPPRVPGDPSDKVMHVVAFAVLGGLAALAFPRRSIAVLFAGLVAFGGLIEIVQAIPVLHRDSELADWLADGAAALLALILARWIARFCSRAG